MYRGRRPVCRGGRLCPPKTRAPCRAGSACPAGKNVSFAAGHMGPDLQVISQGAMPTSPRRHWRGTATLQGSLWEGAVSASRCHLPRRGRQGENGLPRRFAPRKDSASRRRGRRPAVERSGTNALGVRRPVCRGGRLCPPCTLRSSRRSEALQHKKEPPAGGSFCLFRADRSGIRCRYRSRPGCSNSLSASQTQPRSHLPAD